MPNRETTVTNAYQSTLSAELSAVALTMSLADVTGLTTPFYLVIEPANSSQREYVYVTDLVGNTATIDSRYLAGSAAGSGLVHPSGAVVRMSIMSQHLVDINDRVDDLQSQINAIGDHGGLTGLTDDDHTQYLNDARHDIDARHSAINHHALAGLSDDDHPLYALLSGARAFTGEVAGVTPTVDASLATKGYVDGAVTAGVITDHGALSGLADDDHSQYHNDARAQAWHDADDHSALTAAQIPSLDASKITTGTFSAARIPSLDASKISTGTLSISRIPTGTSSTTVALGNHGHSSGLNTVGQSFALYRWRNIYISSSTPSSSGRQTGDVWLQT